MTVIGKRRIGDLQKKHSDAGKELGSWYAVAKKAVWTNLIDVWKDFKDADQFGKLLIFNVRHNTYRLIVKVDYQSKLLMIKDLLTHKEYEKGAWKRWA